MEGDLRAAKFTGALCLFAAALVWGMSFPAQTAASEVVGPFTFIAGKSSVACLFMLVLIALRKATRRKPSDGSAVRGDAGFREAGARCGTDVDSDDASAGPDATGADVPGAVASGSAVSGPVASGRAARLRPRPRPAHPVRAFLASHRRVIVGGILCGLVLFVADNCQQAGISAYPPDAAASGRAGFLTATYVVIVALLSRFMGRKLHPAVVVAVLVCLAGMYLLCVPMDEGFSGIYLGDVIMLAGALFYAFHIVAVGRFALEDALWLSCAQFFTSAALSSVCAFALEGATPLDALPAALPILYVGIFSTGLGYTLQNVGQRTVAEAPAAILMSLESVFAALGGWMLLGERLSGAELFGCALVFAAVLLAQLPQLVKSRARSS